MDQKPTTPTNPQVAIGAWLAIGAGIGTALGVAFNNIGLGIALGVAIGLAIGAGMASRGGTKRND
jgi:ABC-type nitrate/sulfonate/bicarbonate transport system permease component